MINKSSGIYIHIPFCKQACRYCDFYFTVSLRYIDDFLNALHKEVLIKSKETPADNVSTIYFGGGTPSLLSEKQLLGLLDLIKKSFHIDKNAEITIEANPDDLSKEYLEGLISSGFNRISIGIQSFFEEDLKLMRRSHNSIQAKKAVHEASLAGFKNITIDLIYGIPGLNARRWRQNLDEAFSLPVQHISAYHLTYEPGTVFDHWKKKGKLNPVSEQESIKQYDILREVAAKHHFSHYEISNFAKENYHSRHNMIYWNNNKYIGLGPSAHSFDGASRTWNFSSLRKYISAIDSGNVFYEREVLSERDRYHDYIITSLRTWEGLDKRVLEETFGKDVAGHFKRASDSFISSGTLQLKGNFIRLTAESWFISDNIMRELFMS